MCVPHLCEEHVAPDHPLRNSHYPQRDQGLGGEAGEGCVTAIQLGDLEQRLLSHLLLQFVLLVCKLPE